MPYLDRPPRRPPRALVAFGQIQLHKIDGHKQLPSFVANEWQKVA